MKVLAFVIRVTEVRTNLFIGSWEACSFAEEMMVKDPNPDGISGLVTVETQSFLC